MLQKVIQVYPQHDFTVYVYFENGKIKLFDMKPLLQKGIFQKISEVDFFLSACTVLNNTLAWDLSGTYDPSNCIDIDPEEIYQKGSDVKDPLSSSAYI